MSSSAPAAVVDGGGRHRVVSCDLAFAVVEPAEVVLQLVPSQSAGRVVDESLTVSCDGTPVPGMVELVGPHGSRIQILDSPVGHLRVTYRAEIEASPAPPVAEAVLGPSNIAVDPAGELARLEYLRPSRYCPSDHLVGFAVSEFGTTASARARVAAITQWIRSRIGYVEGSSTVHDSAEHTLLTGMGTCRDFAHLGVALCRAVGIPARFTAVYAPGLSPMDFHAVFETLESGQWLVHDATGLAPRQSLVRIVTGRDAADAAFASINSGLADLETMEVTATTSGRLPVDDPDLLVALA
jgi:hypothetical protein